jgi:hypothetical protein
MKKILVSSVYDGANEIDEVGLEEFVEWVGDRIDRGLEYEFDLEMFEKYFPYIKNVDMLERCIDEENEEGSSDNWDNVIFEEGV